MLVALGTWSIAGAGDHDRAKADCELIGGLWKSDAVACDFVPRGSVARLLRNSKLCGFEPDAGFETCSYFAGPLHVDIVGVGAEHASIAFDGVDERNAFGVGVFLDEHCAMVSPGARLTEREPSLRIEHAFISTTSGEVYQSLMACRLGVAESGSDGGR